MDKIDAELNLNVVGQCPYQSEFSAVSYGDTVMYLLSESHFLFIRSPMKKNERLFTYSLGTDFEIVQNVIKYYLDVSIFKRCLQFHT